MKTGRRLLAVRGIASEPGTCPADATFAARDGSGEYADPRPRLPMSRALRELPTGGK